MYRPVRFDKLSQNHQHRKVNYENFTGSDRDLNELSLRVQGVDSLAVRDGYRHHGVNGVRKNNKKGHDHVRARHNLQLRQDLD